MGFAPTVQPDPVVQAVKREAALVVLRDAAVARLGVAEDTLEPKERPFDAAPDGGLGELDASVEVEIGLSLLGERALLVFNELFVLAHRARLGRDEPLLRVEIELSDILALEAPRVARVDEDPLRFLPREHVPKASDVVLVGGASHAGADDAGSDRRRHVKLHAEVPGLGLATGSHLRISRTVLVLRGARGVDEGGVNGDGVVLFGDRAILFGGLDGIHEQRSAEVVVFHAAAEAEDRRVGGHLAAGRKAAETADVEIRHQQPLHTGIGQIQRDLHQVKAQHAVNLRVAELGGAIFGEGVPDDSERATDGLVGDSSKHPHDVVRVLLTGGVMPLQFKVGKGKLGIAAEQNAAGHEKNL